MISTLLDDEGIICLRAIKTYEKNNRVNGLNDIRVSLGDLLLFSAATVTANTLQIGLNKLAAHNIAHIELNKTNNAVVYVIPRDYESRLRSKHFRVVISLIVERFLDILKWAIVLIFGISLIISIILGMVAIIFLLILIVSKSGGKSNVNIVQPLCREFELCCIRMPRIWFWNFHYRPNYELQIYDENLPTYENEEKKIVIY